MELKDIEELDDKGHVKTLRWRQSDPEQKFGFRAGKFTSCNLFFTGLIGLLLTFGFFALIVYGVKPREQWSMVSDMFLERGVAQYASVFLFFWAVSILWIKRHKLILQERALDLESVPHDPAFILSPDTSEEVLKRIRESVDAPDKFILLNRIERALSNLRNLGNVGDVSTILKHQSENDEEHAAASYSLVNGFIWAIPVIGFIGTVLGLSQSMAAFGGTLRSASEISALKGSLTEVTGGLATAFETTLVALVAALILQLALTILQNRENTFLDACNDYCHAHIASRLRLIR